MTKFSREFAAYAAAGRAYDEAVHSHGVDSLHRDVLSTRNAFNRALMAYEAVVQPA